MFTHRKNIVVRAYCYKSKSEALAVLDDFLKSCCNTITSKGYVHTN